MSRHKKFLRPFTGTGSVFFPIGPPPFGTCEFASASCLSFCYAARNEFPDYDEELLIPEDEKQKTYELFIIKAVDELADMIEDDLDGLQTPILSWFGSGDCPSKLTVKVGRVIARVASRYPDIVQMGFTRNAELWRTHKNIFALSIESKDEAAGREGLFSIANYKTQTSIMYSPSYKVHGGYCGPVVCRDLYDEELEHFINCRTCYRLGTGCFCRPELTEVEG